jgi:hypothetical protein
MYLYIYIYAYIFIHIYIYIYAIIPFTAHCVSLVDEELHWVVVDIYIYIYIYTYVCIFIYISKYIYTCIHMFIHNIHICTAHCVSLVDEELHWVVVVIYI